ncbi:hypothetical protein F5Y09DRAFT_337696 [Xylaria sp. FL1042]|nr:hypothetical protein F5Y09DRAFT_337696 [Xylaria sp. FL1042]
MDRKSVVSQGYHGFRCDQERHEASRSLSFRSRGPFSDEGYPVVPNARYTDDEWEASMRPISPSRRRSGSLSPFVYSPARMPSPNDYQFRPELYRSEHTVSQPMPIPNAIPKQRLPVIDRDGYIYKLESKAPHTEEQIRLLKESEEQDIILAEKFRRNKQAIYKWDAENKERERHAAEKKAAGITTPSDEPSTRQRDIRASHQPDRVPTAKHIQIGFKPGFYQGPQQDDHPAGPSTGGSGYSSGRYARGH